MHSSPYFLLLINIATGTKASAIEGCQTWMSLNLSDTECPAYIYIYNTYIFYSAIPRWASSTRLFTYMYIIYYINIY